MTSHTQQLHSTQTESVDLGLEEHFLEVLSFYFFTLVFGQSVFFLTACVLVEIVGRLGLPALTFQLVTPIGCPGMSTFLKSAPLDLSIEL